ncbi:MAG: PDZ domain-containing protein [Flavobacteriales bacterium]|nr:PDZ domain-containing protein [Flavobacteriales bacterium]
MYKTFLFMPLAAVFQGGTAPQAIAQEQEKERKVRIEIVTTENGETKRVTHEFDAANEDAMHDAMRELGIMDHFTLNGDDRDMEIDIRRFGGPDDLDELNMLFAPVAPDAPDAPLPPLPPMCEPKGYLGVSSSSLSKEQAKESKAPGGKGAYVTEVIDDTPAQKLGLKQGDVITQVGDKSVSDPETLSEAVGSNDPGEKVKVTWYRSGKKMNGTAELAESQSSSYSYSFDSDHGSEDWDWENYLGDGVDMEPRAFLGVTPGEGDGDGAHVGSVEEGTAAEQMGIVKGDVITKVNEVAISDFSTLSKTIRAMKPEEAVRVTVNRDGKEMVLNGALGKRDFDHVITMNPSREFRFEGLAPEDRDEMRREMDELRREMDQMRRDFRQDMRVETRIRIERKQLTDEEKALLKNKGVTTLDNELKLGDMNVFPNPSNGFFRLQFDVAEKGDLFVNVHDAKGEKVYEERISGFKGRYERTLDLTDKATGTYYLVVEQGGKSVAEKLVKE